MAENKVDDMSIAGASMTVTIDGKEYTKRQLTLGDFAKLEAHIKSQRIMALHAALEDGKPERVLLEGSQVLKNPEYIDWLEQKSALTIAVTQTAVTGEEVDAAAMTVSGARLLYKCILDGNADMPEGGIDALIRPDNVREIGALLIMSEDTQTEEDDSDSPPVTEQTDG